MPAKNAVQRVRQELGLLNEYLDQASFVETEFLVTHCELLLNYARDLEWDARNADERAAA